MKSYTDLIDKALLQRQADDESNYFPLRPSAAGYHACRLAYDLASYMGFIEKQKEVKDPDVIRLLSLGSNVEWHSIKNFDLIQTIDPAIKIKYKQQATTLFRLKPVSGEKDGKLIEGSIDFAVQDGEHLDVYDCKSKGDKFSQSYKTMWDESIAKFSQMQSLEQFGETSWFAKDLPSFLKELNDPFFEHNFHQVNAYANTGWFKEHGGRHGGVYRYCKNDSRHLEIRFEPSQEMFEELEAKFNYIYKTVMETKDPRQVKKECWLGSPVTAFSSCKDTCWDEDALKAYFKTFPKKTWPTDIKDDGLNGLFGHYESLEAAVNEREETEEEILKILVDQEETKIKTDKGKVYEVKHLKSPRPHFELRRSKV